MASRRSVLALAASGLLAGCTGDPDPGDPDRESPCPDAAPKPARGDPVSATATVAGDARDRADSEASERLGRAVRNRIGSGLGVVVSVSHDRTLGVELWHHYDREGQLLSAPEVSFERLVDRSPREVRVELSIDGRTYRETFAVEVGCTVLQND